MKDILLTFEYNDVDENLEIHANKQGLKFPKRQIEKLEVNNTNFHLITSSWGGDELSEEKQGENNKLINHVKIFHWE
ncbi:MAG: methylhydantoinase [Firmicutes bacterium]|nr:methylhydantoinase [Bacillota bacterium]